MSKAVTEGRRVSVVIDYNGKNIDEYLQSELISFTYKDAGSGEQDDISLQLDDRGGKWLRAWKPDVGDKIKAVISTINWDKEGQKLKLPCGTFEVDTVEPSGPPDIVDIKAVSIPIAGHESLRTKRSKSWEKTKLKTIAAEIAGRAKLKLNWQSKTDPPSDNYEMSDQTDFNFLVETCKNFGLAIKVTNAQLVIFDEEDFEKRKPSFDIERGKSNVISYKFENIATMGLYSKCVVEYRSTTSVEKKTAAKKPTTPTTPKPEPPKYEYDPQARATTTPTKPTTTKKKVTKKTVIIRGEYTAPGIKGPVLEIKNQKVENAAEARMIAKNKLREKNKEVGRATIVLDGSTIYATGVTFNLKGWGKADGKYIIESCEHNAAGGAYITTLEIRKVIGG